MVVIMFMQDFEGICVLLLASYSAERQYGGGEQAPCGAEPEYSQREPSPSRAQPREPRPAPQPTERIPVCITQTHTRILYSVLMSLSLAFSLKSGVILANSSCFSFALSYRYK